MERTIVEAKVAGISRIPHIRSRTPIVTIVSYIAERRLSTKTGCRQEDRTAVRSGHFAAFVTVLRSPLPCTVVDKFLDLRSCRQPPCATPVGSCSIVAAVARYVAHAYAVGRAVGFLVFGLRTYLSPCIIVSVVRRGGRTYIAGRSLDTQAEVDPLVAVDETSATAAVSLLFVQNCEIIGRTGIFGRASLFR